MLLTKSAYTVTFRFAVFRYETLIIVLYFSTKIGSKVKWNQSN